MNENDLKQLVAPAVEALGFTCVGVEVLASRDAHSVVRLYIDSPDGVKVEDCAQVSRQAGSLLDVADAIHGHYTLEVSSPGLERRLFSLDQYPAFIGRLVHLRFQTKWQERRQVTGTLLSVTETDVVIEMDGETVTIPYAMVARANLVVNW